MPDLLDSIRHLPDHHRVLGALLATFERMDSISGIFASGSTANRSMDEWSDLDLGIVLQNVDDRSTVWSQRWDWQLEPWFHRFDADHIKPHFVIYLFDPCVKADINLYTPDDLPSWKGAPFEIVYDTAGILEPWVKESNASMDRMKRQPMSMSPEEIDHDDERIWAWLIYCALHLQRGEYYSILSGFDAIRKVIERWTAYLRQEPGFDVRRLETRWPTDTVVDLSALYTTASHDTIKTLLLHTIRVHLDLRAQLAEKHNIIWTTEKESIDRIQHIILSI